MRKTIKGIATVITFLLWIGLGLTHIWCCYIAYTVAPFWQVALTFFLPVLSEIYWMFILWQAIGLTLFHVIVFGLVCLLLIFGFIAVKLSD